MTPLLSEGHVVMRRIELARKIGPDAAIALWHEVESELETTDLAAGGLLLEAQHVQYLSAAGLQVLLVAAARLARDGARLHLHAPSAAFREALTHLGANHLIGAGLPAGEALP